MKTPFKTCTKCGHEWKARKEFLSDPAVTLIGFQADFEDFKKGFYLFNHILEDFDCNTSIAVRITNFLDLYDGPLFNDLKFGSKECSGYCAKVDELKRCTVNCRNAVAREIMLEILNYNKV